MLQGILILNLFIVLIRFYKFAFKKVKPTFKEEGHDYIEHIIFSHLIYFTIMLLFSLF
jgi:hypothetical protein